MFLKSATSSFVAALLGLSANSASKVLPRQNAAQAVTRQTFIQSFEYLATSFSKCQQAVSEGSSIQVVTESVQTVTTSYTAAVNQYQSCSLCTSRQADSQYTSKVQTLVTQMYSSFQTILQTGPSKFNTAWNSQVASKLRSLSSFGDFTNTVCLSFGIKLTDLLSNIGISVGLFANIGININLGGLLKIGGNGGLLSGLIH